MRTERTLCIDLRWIDSSGVGMYIQGVLPGLIHELSDVSIVGLGNRARLSAFDWSHAANVQLIECRAGRYSMAEQFELPRAIPSHANLFFSPYYTIPLFYRGRIAVTVHDMTHLVVDEIVSNWKKRTYAQIMYRTLRRRASVVFTVSEYTRTELLRLTAGPRQDNIIPTHLGVSPEWYRARERLPIRRRPYFVAVGNVKPYKNIGRLVDAFLQVQQHIPHDLVIIGQSESLITGESPQFFERVRSGGDRIQMTGFVPQDELLSLVAHATAIFVPSLCEGFGLPPLEAMAAGVPAAVARAGSLPEVCADAAVYFDPLNVDEIAKSLVQMATDATLCKQLSEEGLKRSRTFTWASCARRTAQELRACLDMG